MPGWLTGSLQEEEAKKAQEEAAEAERAARLAAAEAERAARLAAAEEERRRIAEEKAAEEKAKVDNRVSELKTTINEVTNPSAPLLEPTSANNATGTRNIAARYGTAAEKARRAVVEPPRLTIPHRYHSLGEYGRAPGTRDRLAACGTEAKDFCWQEGRLTQKGICTALIIGTAAIGFLTLILELLRKSQTAPITPEMTCVFGNATVTSPEGLIPQMLNPPEVNITGLFAVALACAIKDYLTDVCCAQNATLTALPTLSGEIPAIRSIATNTPGIIADVNGSVITFRSEGGGGLTEEILNEVIARSELSLEPITGNGAIAFSVYGTDTVATSIQLVNYLQAYPDSVKIGNLRGNSAPARSGSFGATGFLQAFLDRTREMLDSMHGLPYDNDR